MSESKILHLGYGKAPVAPAAKKGEAQKPAPPHLPIAPGYSHRAVRVRFLDPAEVTHLRAQATNAIGEDSKMLEYDDAVATLGVEQMVEAYTDPVKPAKLLEAMWTDTDGEKLSTKLLSIFTTKDIEFLKAVYLRHHHVNKAEVDAIMEGSIGSVA